MNNDYLTQINNIEDVLKDINLSLEKPSNLKSTEDEKKAILSLYKEIEKIRLYIKVITEELILKKYF
jgi:C4-type Zn-finger protein